VVAPKDSTPGIKASRKTHNGGPEKGHNIGGTWFARHIRKEIKTREKIAKKKNGLLTVVKGKEEARASFKKETKRAAVLEVSKKIRNSSHPQ